jgi:hypothetical protein
LRGFRYFEGKGDGENAAAWGKVWAGLKDSARGKVAVEAAVDLSVLLEGRKDFVGAAEVLKLAAGKGIGMEHRVELMRRYLIVACDGTEDTEGVLKECAAWRKNLNEGEKGPLRGVQAATVYAAIASGDGKLAEKVLAEMKEGGGGVKFNEGQLRQGVLARNVENYIRTKEYETAFGLLNQWELEFPEAMWEGFTRTLRVKLAAAQGRNAAAGRMALAHAKANSGGFYAAELVYRAAEHFKAAGEGERAKGAMELLGRKYPESPYARVEGK